MVFYCTKWLKGNIVFWDILFYVLFWRFPPFGYENKNGNIVNDIKNGIQEEQFKELQNDDFVDLLKQMLNVYF